MHGIFDAEWPYTYQIDGDTLDDDGRYQPTTYTMACGCGRGEDGRWYAQEVCESEADIYPVGDEDGYDTRDEALAVAREYVARQN